MTNIPPKQPNGKAPQSARTNPLMQQRMRNALVKGTAKAQESVNTAGHALHDTVQNAAQSQETSRTSDNASPTQYAEQRSEEIALRSYNTTAAQTNRAAQYGVRKLQEQFRSRQQTQRQDQRQGRNAPASFSRAQNSAAPHTRTHGNSNPNNTSLKSKGSQSSVKARTKPCGAPEPPMRAKPTPASLLKAQTPAQYANKQKQTAHRATRLAVKTADALRKAAKTLKKVAAAIWQSLKSLIELIKAGGWVSVVVIAVLVAMVIGVASVLYFASPTGLFFSNEASENGRAMTEAIAGINSDFYTNLQLQITALASSISHNSLSIVYDGDLDGDSLTVNNWIDVLGVYAVHTTMGGTASSMDVITVTPAHIARLREIFKEMNEVEFTTQTETTEETYIIDGEEQIITTTHLTIHVSLDSLTYTEGADLYNFNQEQRDTLSLLMGQQFVTEFARLLGTDPMGGVSLGDITTIFPPNASGSAIVQAALSKVGCKYVWGAKGPDQFDCSGLVYYALSQAGIPHAGAFYSTAAGQAEYCYNNGWIISTDQLQPGDLVFWQNAACNKGDRWNEIHHTGTYIGSGKVIEASSSKGCVLIRDLWSSTSYPIYFCARLGK